MNPDARLQVLFVDDEPRLLDGLRRQLRAYRNQWEVRFAESGAAALDLLAESCVDIVVSDMRMPGMNGGEFLHEVLRRHPQTVRIVLSGQTDESELMTTLGPIHFYLHKPCEIERLVATINRTARIVQRMRVPAMQRAVGRIISLPPMSDNYQRLLNELNNPNASVASIAKLMDTDVAMTSKMLQLVNSAFFALPNSVTSIASAVSLLGLRTVHGIVVAGRIFEQLQVDDRSRAAIQAIWRTSAEIGSRSAEMARERGLPCDRMSVARLAGMFSLLGRAILHLAEPAACVSLVSRAGQGENLTTLEVERFGVGQECVGAYALGIWGFSDDLVEVVAHHLDGAGVEAASLVGAENPPGDTATSQPPVRSGQAEAGVFPKDWPVLREIVLRARQRVNPSGLPETCGVPATGSEVAA